MDINTATVFKVSAKKSFVFYCNLGFLFFHFEQKWSLEKYWTHEFIVRFQVPHKNTHFTS